MQHYFVVSKSTDDITAVVQRTSQPQNLDDKKFVKADGLLLPIYYRLLSQKTVVTLQEVLNY